MWEDRQTARKIFCVGRLMKMSCKDMEFRLKMTESGMKAMKWRAVSVHSYIFRKNICCRMPLSAQMRILRWGSAIRHSRKDLKFRLIFVWQDLIILIKHLITDRGLRRCHTREKSLLRQPWIFWYRSGGRIQQLTVKRFLYKCCFRIVVAVNQNR